MKKEIVYTDKYALILSDERIEDVRPHKGKFHLEQGSFINQFPTYLTDLTECKLIISHLPLSDAPILEGVPLLPSFSWGQQDDVEELAEREYPTFNLGLNATTSVHTISQEAFIIGYNKAKDKYQFTQDDMINAFKLGERGVKYQDHFVDVWEDFKKLLQQPSRPTHFECEMENCDKCVYVQGGNLSPDCCNQLKPKTTTNSQGQVELVGKYI